LDASDLRIAVAVSSYHTDITDALLAAAEACFSRHGGQSDHLSICTCPGTWELPGALSAMGGELDPPPDACVALGCVIRGDTSHDRWINEATSEALMAMSVNAGIPVSFGILTCDTMAQAEARAGGARGNKGEEAMAAAIAQALANRRTAWGSRT